MLSVDRAVSELRRGRMVCIQGSNGAAILAVAAEAVTPERLAELARVTKSEPELAITARRATVLGLPHSDSRIAVIETSTPLSAAQINDIADPLGSCSLDPQEITVRDSQPYDSQSAAVMLSKLARLLPSVVCANLHDPDANDLFLWTSRHNLLLVDAGDVFQYDTTAARTLSKVSEAIVPLAGAEKAKIIAFRPVDGGLEHLAIIIGEPNPGEPVLTRLHSECFTGDLLGSLRCDCGDQLQGAIKQISERGSGVLLYLAQEGRGIGLVNKLRAYQLQDQGFDTIDANEQLGYEADERVYLPAAKMLQLLGFNRIRLMTNNPDKQTALVNCGVDVVERVTHSFPSNQHNETYLKTKAARSGHQF